MRCALLHGFAGSPAAWSDVIEAWQLPVAPIAIALPGHGGGPVAASWQHNLELVGAAIAGSDVVVGYSLGARVALGLVVAGLARRAVLIGVNPGISADEREPRRADDARWARMLREHGMAAFDAAWTAQPLFATQARVPAERRETRRAQRLALDAPQLAVGLETMGLASMPDYRGELDGHREQLALIAGADDAKFVAIARTLPAASFETIVACGHDPTLEQPRELAAAIARAVSRLR